MTFFMKIVRRSNFGGPVQGSVRSLVFQLITISLLPLAIATPSVAAIIGPRARLTSVPSRQEYEPVIASSPGVLVAAWSSNAYQSVGTSYSIDGGATWIDLGDLQASAGIDRVDGEASICSDGLGTFYLAALVCDIDPPGGIFVAVWRGSLVGQTFSWAQPTLATPTCQLNFNGYLTDPCWEMPSIACIPGSDTVVVSVTRISTQSLILSLNTIEFVRSTDGALTWSAPTVLSSTKSKGSAVTASRDGYVYVTWRDLATGSIRLAASGDAGQTFGGPVTVGQIVDNSASGPPGYRPRYPRQNPVYVVCGTELTGNDYPSIAVDNSGSSKDGTIYVAWAERASGVIQAGSGFVDESEPNNDLSRADSIAVGNTTFGTIQGELTGGPDRDAFFFDGVAGRTIYLRADMTSTSPAPPSDTWRCGGLVIYCGRDTNVVVARTGMREVYRGLFPGIIFTLPETGRYYIRVGTTIFTTEYTLTFRSFAINATSTARDHRDIVVARSIDNGQTWSAKELVTVADQPSDDSLPSVAVDRFGNPVVAWYGVAPTELCGAQFDAMVSWIDSPNIDDQSIRISGLPSSWQHVISGNHSSNVGDRLGLTANDEGAQVAWMQRGLPDIDVYAASVQQDVVVPVTFGNFTAHWAEAGAILSWEVWGGDEFVNFELHRHQIGGIEDGAIVIVTSQPGQAVYHAADNTADSNVDYIYSLFARQRNGRLSIGQPAYLPSQMGERTQLRLTVFPNPFSERVTIEVLGSGNDRVLINICDISGRRVRSIPDLAATAGYSWEWDGADDNGHETPAGLYLIIVKSKKGVAVSRVLRCK